MYRSEDYLDPSKAKEPYGSSEEHMHDCLAYFELILGSFIEKVSRDPGMYYMPGIMMSEEQAGKYYRTRPVDRETGLFDPDTATEASLARAHILSRESCSDIPLPIRTVREEFGLSLLEELAVFISLDLAVNINLRNLYAYMGNDALIKQASAGMLYSLYCLIDPEADISLADRLCDPCGPMSVFFLRFGAKTDEISSLMDMPIALRGDMLTYLLGGENSGRETDTRNADTVHGRNDTTIPYTRIYDGEPLGIDICKEAADALPPDDEGTFVYVKTPDGDDVLMLLAERRGAAIPVLDAARLFRYQGRNSSRASEAAIAQEIGGYLTYVRLNDAIPVVKLDGMADMSDAVCLFNVLKRFLPKRTVYLYGSGILPAGFGAGFDIYPVKLSHPDVEVREKLWKHYLDRAELKISDDISVDDLADCYDLSASDIKKVVWRTSGQVKWQGRDVITRADLKEHLFALAESTLSSLATYIPSTFVWDDLQIDPKEREVLITACDRFRHRNRVDRQLGNTARAAYGNGVSILLYGPPGTGKTMAAQVVSEELQLPLYRIDVSQIYSKYIGETQKNLGEVFDRAQETNVILFFDEADAVFSKRTDVGDSHDKYANADTAYLLQKIEAHRGMVILATNLFQNIDMAFVRRLTYVVRLSKPDEDVRLSLWRSILPPTVKIADDVDFEFFAKAFDIPGSNIKAVLYSAMYMAGSENRELTNRDIVRAMKYDSDKTGIYNDPSRFGQYASYLYD